MEENKQQWYYSQMGYEGKDGFVTQDSTYIQLPSNWDKDTAEGEAGQLWRNKYHWKQKGFAWKVEAVEHPSKEWLNKKLELMGDQRDYIEEKTVEYIEIIENIENK